MTNKVYVLYNTLSNRYGDVMCYPSDGLAVARVQPALVNANVLGENELCRIGDIDIESGVLTPCAPVRVAWREDPLPVNNSSN